MDSKFKIRLPGHLDITLDDSNRVQNIVAGEDSQGEEESASSQSLSSPARAPYISRREAGITFYDLGTRRSPDGTYRDIIPSHLPAPLNFWQFWHDTFLQGDYTVKGACLKIPQKAQFLYFDVNLIPANPEFDFRYELIGDKQTRPLIHNTGSPVFASRTHFSGGSLAYTQVKSSTGSPIEDYLSIESAFYYNGFHTFPNAHYKITATPDPMGAGVSYTVRNKDRVFLIPLLTLQRSLEVTPLSYYISRFLPIAQGFRAQIQALQEAYINTSIIGGVPVTEARGTATTELWTAIQAYYDACFPPDIPPILFDGGLSGSRSIDDMTKAVGVVFGDDGTIIGRTGLVGFDLIAHPRTLVAVIIRDRGARKFYVWQNEVISVIDGSSILPGAPRVSYGHNRVYAP